MKDFMNNLPTVISCCFCCFLRAGTVMIAVFSFFVGLLFAPNITHAKGFWEMESVLSGFSGATESTVQMMLGILSVMLCIVSCLLLIGALCNFPFLILVYQWGAVVYSACVLLLFFVLALLCFFIHTNCFQAGGVLVGLIVVNVLVTTYFVLVANSLRVSLEFLRSEEFTTVA